MLSLQVTKWLYKVIWTIDTLYVHVGQTLTIMHFIFMIPTAGVI
jgi:hypothetical protein